VLLTRLELFIRRDDLEPVKFGRAAGYSRMHFYRLRMGERDATRAAILAVTGAARRLTRKRVSAASLFERADALLKGGGQRLSAAHRADRAVLADLLRDIHDQPDNLPRFGERLQASGVASETAVTYLIRAGEALLITNPEAAGIVFKGAVDMSAALNDSPRELVQALLGHSYLGCANALRLLVKFNDALFCLARARERFIDAAYCADEAGGADYIRATIYLQLEQWEEALSAVRLALRYYRQTSDTRGAAKAEVLEAVILFELGDMDAAHAKWMRLTKVFAQLRQRNDLARASCAACRRSACRS
jgi:tetratricopeptide (TPR) repeat protein